MLRAASAPVLCSESADMIDNRWVRGSVSEMCHLQATVTSQCLSESAGTWMAPPCGVGRARHIHVVVHTSHGRLVLS